jgi:hypothetical protein
VSAEKEAFLSKKRALLREIRLSKRELSPEEMLLLEENSDEEEELGLPAVPPPEYVDNNGDSESGSSSNSSSGGGGARENYSAESDANIRSHVSLPSQQEINAAIVEQKKKMLMERLTIL